MTKQLQTAVDEPVEDTVRRKRGHGKRRHKPQPRFHVILWNDDHHSYDYVIRMLQDLFRHQSEQGFQMADEVHHTGRAICLTTTKEHAELKRDQIHAFGKDGRIAHCKGSMSATIEPEPG